MSIHAINVIKALGASEFEKIQFLNMLNMFVYFCNRRNKHLDLCTTNCRHVCRKEGNISAGSQNLAECSRQASLLSS